MVFWPTSSHLQMSPYFHLFKKWSCLMTRAAEIVQTEPLMYKLRKKDDGNEFYDLEDDEIWKEKVRWLGGRRYKRTLGRRRPIVSVCVAMIVFILLLGILCLALPSLFPWPICDRTFADVLADESDLRFVEVARMCGSDGHCRTVMDIISRKSNSARRALFFGKLTDSFESEVALICPTNATVEDSDTRLWRVDHAILLNEYVAAMALMPFLVGSLSFSSADAHRLEDVAVIGLGGGSLDAFLHFKFSWLNITVFERDSLVVDLAKQWFEVSDDQTRRTMVGDGVAAISAHAKKGNRFDAIILDACDTSPHIACPAAPFIALEHLEEAKSALRPLGVFVVNALPTNEQNEQMFLSLLQLKLLSVFPLCVRMRMGRQLNSIFACVPYSIGANDSGNTMRLWRQRKEQIAGQLQLHSLLRDARLTDDNFCN